MAIALAFSERGTALSALMQCCLSLSPPLSLFLLIFPPPPPSLQVSVSSAYSHLLLFPVSHPSSEFSLEKMLFLPYGGVVKGAQVQDCVSILLFAPDFFFFSKQGTGTTGKVGS